jgi:hypothetical protein
MRPTRDPEPSSRSTDLGFDQHQRSSQQTAEHLTLEQRVRRSSPWRRTIFPGQRAVSGLASAVLEEVFRRHLSSLIAESPFGQRGEITSVSRRPTPTTLTPWANEGWPAARGAPCRRSSADTTEPNFTTDNDNLGTAGRRSDDRRGSASTRRLRSETSPGPVAHCVSRRRPAASTATSAAQPGRAQQPATARARTGRSSGVEGRRSPQTKSTQPSSKPSGTKLRRTAVGSHPAG